MCTLSGFCPFPQSPPRQLKASSTDLTENGSHGYEKCSFDANALASGNVNSSRWTTDRAAAVRSAAPSAAPAWDTHEPQAAASNAYGCKAPALNHCPPARLPLLRCLTIFAGGFAKLLYVGLS